MIRPSPASCDTSLALLLHHKSPALVVEILHDDPEALVLLERLQPMALLSPAPADMPLEGAGRVRAKGVHGAWGALPMRFFAGTFTSAGTAGTAASTNGTTEIIGRIEFHVGCAAWPNLGRCQCFNDPTWTPWSPTETKPTAEF